MHQKHKPHDTDFYHTKKKPNKNKSTTPKQYTIIVFSISNILTHGITLKIKTKYVSIYYKY